MMAGQDPQKEAPVRRRKRSGQQETYVFINDPWLKVSRDRRFLRIAAVVASALLLLGLFLVKIWNTAPPGYERAIRVSGLDLAQSWSLSRSAERYARDGKWLESMTAWRSAIANNRGNLDLYRRLLITLTESQDKRREYFSFAASAGRELLKLSRTNNNDAELLAAYFRRFEAYDAAVYLLGRQEDSLASAGARIYAEALFFTGATDKFAAYWKAHESQLTPDPQCALIHTAWNAFWGPPAGMAGARADLASARKDPRLGILAAKLQLRVSYNIPDALTYKSALDQLVERHEDRAGDHALYWKMLMEQGRTAEAAELARKFGEPPKNIRETILLSSVFDALHMADFAADFLANQLKVFGGDPDYWIERARILMELGRWDPLHEAAVTIRNNPDLANLMDGYAYFIEGVAESNQHRAENAETLFTKAANGRYPSPLLAVRTANSLRSLGFAKPAADLLKKNEAAFKARQDFWIQLTLAALEAKDTDLMLQAADRAYTIDRSNLSAVNNYAASLLVTRTKADEAVKLTLELTTANPGRIDFQINHALALALNSRLDDAERVLLTIPASNLNNDESTMLHFAWFDIRAQKDQARLALDEAKQIERRLLLPPQIQYLDDTIERLGGK